MTFRIWEDNLMEDLRVRFLGAGGFATHTIYPALHFAPLVLKAICDIDREKANRNARKFGGGANVYTDRHQMYQDEDLEAMVISMGPESRLSFVIEALEAGYHVFTLNLRRLRLKPLSNWQVLPRRIIES